jgi:hypothetical protein
VSPLNLNDNVEIQAKEKLAIKTDFFSSDRNLDRNVAKLGNSTKDILSSTKIKRDSDILSNLREPALPLPLPENASALQLPKRTSLASFVDSVHSSLDNKDNNLTPLPDNKTPQSRFSVLSQQPASSKNKMR